MFLILVSLISVVIGGLIGFFIGKRLQNTSSLEATEVILRKIREQVTGHILNDNPRLFNAIAKQKLLLNEKGRNAVAIFISEAEFLFILKEIGNNNLQYINELHLSLIELNVPIGFLGVLPIYVSRLLTEAPIFVVGSIRWEL